MFGICLVRSNRNKKARENRYNIFLTCLEHVRIVEATEIGRETEKGVSIDFLTCSKYVTKIILTPFSVSLLKLSIPFKINILGIKYSGNKPLKQFSKLLLH
jgi:hypothetical protein